VSFVVAVLGSQLERESAAAAAALWPNIGPAPGPPILSSRGWLWAIWEDVFEVGRPDWGDFLWFGQPGEAPYGRGGEIEEPETVPWQPDQWEALYRLGMSRWEDAASGAAVLSLLVRWRLARGLRSPDPITRSLSAAPFLPIAEEEDESPVSTTTRSHGEPISTMIHGTFGWKGNWWRPRLGSFHDFILNNHRHNLYRGGARFSWSGAYRASQRRLAASDFCDWANEMARAGLETVLAHSYGGEVAARAKIAGAQIDQIVLLSSPVNSYVYTIATDPALTVVDVRLNFDPVLGLARTRQRIRPLPANVTEVILSAWRLDHGATHKESVWNAENVAVRGGI